MDQVLRLGQAQLHHRDQTVSGGDDAPVFGMFSQLVDGILQRPWAMGGKWRGYHLDSSRFVAHDRAPEGLSIFPGGALLTPSAAPGRGKARLCDMSGYAFLAHKLKQRQVLSAWSSLGRAHPSP